MSRAPASKYSMAAALERRGRTATVKSSAAASLSKKQLTPQTTGGLGMSASSISVMTPSVPSEPTNRSRASMSSAAK